MTWIKICGTTNLEDALLAVEAGADALGFVFYENSPRNVASEVVRDIVPELPENVEKVGVVPNFAAAQALRASGLTGIQVHAPLGIDRSGSSHAVGIGPTIRTIYLSFSVSDLMGERPRIEMDFLSFVKIREAKTTPSPFKAVFLDSGRGRLPGGTGKTFDWEQASELVETISHSIKVVVAGGLNPGNVADAIRILNPWGVDVVSGVEASPGKKDPGKVRAFVNAVRQAEKSK